MYWDFFYKYNHQSKKKCIIIFFYLNKIKFKIFIRKLLFTNEYNGSYFRFREQLVTKAK